MKPYLLGASFVLGVLFADSGRPGSFVAVMVGALGVIFLATAWWIHGADPGEGQLLNRLRFPVVTLALLGTAALGYCDLGAREALRLRSPLPDLDGRVVELGGSLATDPQPLGTAWGFTLKSISFVDGMPLRGRLAVRSFDEQPGAVLGDQVRVEVKIVALDPEDPFDRMEARKGIAAKGALLLPVRVLSQSTNPLVIVSNFFRQRMSEAANATLRPDTAALLQGLVIGDDRALSEPVRDDFRASGLSHLTAVSGANLAMVLGALAVALNALKFSKRASIVIGLVVIVLFAVITRWEPSVLRASVMATIALSAFLFGRLALSLNTLAIAFFALLVFDPMLLWSVGFQLSFGATAGILLLRKPLVERLGPVPRLISEPIAIGMAAQVAVFPLIALHFEKVSVAAIPANLVAFCLVSPVTILGLLAGVVSMVSGGLAIPLMWAGGLFAWVLEWVARTFGRSDLSELPVPNFKGFELLATCLGLVALRLWLTRRNGMARWPALIALVIVLGTMLVPALSFSAPSGLRVTFFSVGQGDAALVETPGGARMLVDGGPDPELIAGKLRRRGINRLDLVVASHLHADHVGGLEEVFERVEVGIALHPGAEGELLPTISVDEPLEAARYGERLIAGDLVVQVLGPAPELHAMAVSAAEGGATEGAEMNDASVVLRVGWAGQCVLFTGDLEESGQQILMEAHPEEVDCTVLKAPHHGSGRLDSEFVEAVDPEFVAVSVGKNSYGHPSPKALKIFEDVGARILRTDKLDDVVIEIDSAGRVLVSGN